MLTSNTRDGNDATARERARERDRQSLVRFGLLVAVAFFVASTAPPGLVMAAFSGFLFFGALAAALVAGMVGERLLPPHLTRWDEALALLALSILLGWMVGGDAPLAVGEGIQGPVLQDSVRLGSGMAVAGD